jgi:lipopolysaccharide export system permease protein
MRDLDKLVGKGLSFWVIAQLILLNMSWMLVLAIPMGVLFSTLMAFGNLSSLFEITAMKSGGYSFFQLVTPVLTFSVVLFGFLFWINDVVLQESNHQLKILTMDINRKKPTFSLESGQFSTQIEYYTILARKVDSISNGLRGVTIYDNSKSRQFSTISADSGFVMFVPSLNKLRFTLFKGEVLQLISYEPRDFRKIRFEKLEVLLDAKGFTLERSNEAMVARSDREMRIRDMKEIVAESRKLSQIAQKRAAELLATQPKVMHREMSSDTTLARLDEIMERDFNYLETQITSEVFRITDFESRARQYEVEIHKKYAIPFACIVFALVGCPLGMITKRGNFGISAAISLGFYVFYWACLIGGEKLADRGFISPFLSMWLGNFILGIIGILLILKVNNESVFF